MKNYISNISKNFSSSFLLCALSFLSCGIGFSQTASLSISNVTFSPDTNLLFGDTVTMTYTVKNVGTTPYTGYLDINFSTDSIAFSPAGMCTIPTTTLTPNGFDSVNGMCVIIIDSTYFHSGGNIVVVWSSGNARTAADSIRAHVYLNPSTAGVHETNMISAFKIYPSPTQDFINVEYSESIVPVKIFIEDVSGRIINAISPSRDSKNQIKINTSGLNAGIYFLDILLPDKQRVISKFVKEE